MAKIFDGTVVKPKNKRQHAVEAGRSLPNPEAFIPFFISFSIDVATVFRRLSYLGVISVSKLPPVGEHTAM